MEKLYFYWRMKSGHWKKRKVDRVHPLKWVGLLLKFPFSVSDRNGLKCCFCQCISKNLVGEVLLLIVFIRNTEYSQITCYLRKLNSIRNRCKKKCLNCLGLKRSNKGEKESWASMVRQNKERNMIGVYKYIRKEVLFKLREMLTKEQMGII